MTSRREVGREIQDICLRTRALIARGRDVTLDEKEFSQAALELFDFQYQYNAVYRRFCDLRERTPRNVQHHDQIPAVATSAFKEFDLTVLDTAERTTIFHSSGTSAQRPSRHFHCDQTLAVYEESLQAWFEPHLLPDGERVRFLMLTPTLVEAPHSSLVHMFVTVSRTYGRGAPAFAGRLGEDGSWVLDFDAVQKSVAEFAETKEPVVFCGTAFSFVHLADALEQAGKKLSVPDGSRVLETGGYKGRSRSIPKAELHRMIANDLEIPDTHIISEYGMSELSSQAYDRRSGENAARNFWFPSWARATVISPETGLQVAEGEVGLIRVLDLANVGSVMAVQTEDLARRQGDGFELIGRATEAEPRGCSLMQMDHEIAL